MQMSTLFMIQTHLNIIFMCENIGPDYPKNNWGGGGGNKISTTAPTPSPHSQRLRKHHFRVVND